MINQSEFWGLEGLDFAKKVAYEWEDAASEEDVEFFLQHHEQMDESKLRHIMAIIRHIDSKPVRVIIASLMNSEDAMLKTAAKGFFLHQSDLGYINYIDNET